MNSQPDTPNNAPTQVGDLLLLAGPRQKNFIFRLTPGERIQTHRGILQHDDLIGLPYGTQVFSHLKRAFVLLKPSLSDLLLETKRSTQIMYPKDVGFLLVTMGIGPGQHVLEAGTGSGALTTALAFAVGPQGRVTSYEVRPEMQRLAQKNLDRIGLADRVTFKLRNIQEGFDEQGVDALFLDVPNPYDYLAQARAALKSGGSFGTILPSTNQVVRLMNALYRERFAFVEVCEILLRYYQTHPERLRPVDRMVAHTGYLIFARPVLMEPDKLYEDSETEAEVEDVQLAGEILEDETGEDLQVIEP
jgi:tRNA (adenine57-N1/adenine58-N1)-methyltransferase catalytic subunit